MTGGAATWDGLSKTLTRVISTSITEGAVSKGESTMMFLRDRNTIRFPHNGVIWAITLRRDTVAHIVAINGINWLKRDEAKQEAIKWFIKHQEEFNLEGVR